MEDILVQKENSEVMERGRRFILGMGIVLLVLGIIMCVARFYSEQAIQIDVLTTGDVLTAGGVIFFGLALYIFSLDLIVKTYCCEECGSWRSTVSTSRDLGWDTNVGHVLCTDPFHVRRSKRICNDCGHMMSSRIEGVEFCPN